MNTMVMERCEQCGVLCPADGACPGCLVELALDRGEAQRWRWVGAGLGAGLTLALPILALAVGGLLWGGAAPDGHDAAAARRATVAEQPLAERVPAEPSQPPESPEPPLQVPALGADAERAEVPDSARTGAGELTATLASGDPSTTGSNALAREVAAARALRQRDAAQVAARVAMDRAAAAAQAEAAARAHAEVERRRGLEQRDDAKATAHAAREQAAAAAEAAAARAAAELGDDDATRRAHAQFLLDSARASVERGDDERALAQIAAVLAERTVWSGAAYVRRVLELYQLRLVALERSRGSGDAATAAARAELAAFERLAGRRPQVR